jgi:hypothetical protein
MPNPDKIRAGQVTLRRIAVRPGGRLFAEFILTAEAQMHSCFQWLLGNPFQIVS